MSTKAGELSHEISKSAEQIGEPFVWMGGFFLLGTLLGMLGSLVITWHYHTDAEPRSIGFHFLAMSAGFVLASQVLPRSLQMVPLRVVGISASALAFLALGSLASLSPPVAAGWRIGALGVVGISAGTLAYALFHANQSAFETAPATSANRAGALFVGGALMATVVVGVTYFVGSLKIQTALLSLVPAFYMMVLIRSGYAPARHAHREDSLRETLKDLRSIVTVLFSLLIFFQFACEWAIAGWLPLFLIHTLGINPVTAIWTLGLYFTALMLGRLVAQFVLPIVSHKKLVMISMACAMGGYLLLSLTGVASLAMAAAVIVGLSHAPIYPLIAERLDHRLSYHARFYSGAISMAMAGGTATPWLLSYVDASLGMRAVMLIPALGSIVVLILTMFIMLESRLMGADSHSQPLASD